MSVGPSIANRLYEAMALPAHARFLRATRDPARTQRAILKRIVHANADTRFGRAHEFARVRDVAAFRARVPLRGYDAFADDIQRIAAGERRVLTTEGARFLEPSGGSSGANKLIPYTQGLLREFASATMPWIVDLLRARPALRGGRAYWAVSPPARVTLRTACSLPVGMEHDSDYFPPLARALIDRVLGLPRSVSRAPDIATCRYLTLRALVAVPDLALISVWNPSFLTRLAESLDEHWAALLRDIEHGTFSIGLDPALRAELSRALPARPARARALRRAFGACAPNDLGSLWPRLTLVSCWTEAHATRALSAMLTRFPGVEVQGKGLLATEGVVSLPVYAAGGPVAAVSSHFLEFLPNDESEALMAHEVEIGRTYEIALTTSGGLYRYRLRDIVRVDGFYAHAPVLSFVGRADGASDLVGEKLTPAFVEEVLRQGANETGVRASFAMMAPNWPAAGRPPRYHLYVEADRVSAAKMETAVERGLCASHHYALCRALGQLEAVHAVTVRDGERHYDSECLRRGQRAGLIKPTALDGALDWDSVFADAS